MTDPILEARRAYAEELRFTTHMRSGDLYGAFAKVPRERFLGDGPWRIKTLWEPNDYWTTPDAHARHVYHDVLIALDERLNLNNGQPSFWAFLIDRTPIREGETVIHLGCGTGYYTAILAELVGATGKVVAVDIHEGAIARARSALAPWPQVEVRHEDGSKAALGAADVIVASAGVTQPPPSWLAALRAGGRLLFPLTADDWLGAMLLATRAGPADFALRRLWTVGIYPFSGARDEAVGKRLKRALQTSPMSDVKSLRTDRHPEGAECWLHGDGWCFSRREPKQA